MKGILYAFLGGAIVGCGAALLFTPESGKDMRDRIRRILKKKGIEFSDDDIDELVEQITAEIRD